MHFSFEPIDDDFADVVQTWNYEGDYYCYDTDKNRRSIDNILNTKDFDTFIVLDEIDEPVGFLACTFNDDGIVEMENFLSPDMLGKGLGVDFISECIDFVVDHYDYNQDVIDLVVESHNKRAIKVYERAGFTIVDECEDWVEMQIEL